MHVRNSSIGLLIVAALTSVAVSGQVSNVERRVDEFIGSQMAKQKIPGVAIAVVKDGKPTIAKGYGLSNVELNVPVKPETIFQSGSMGKQFTAAAVMLLVEDGKISLDEKISKYLGEVPENWRNITIRNLLSHTSGMTDYAADFDFSRDHTEADLLKIAKETPVAFAPGEGWEYSNLGYVTLGIIIGKVTGKFYGDFLRERIFTPAGMTSAQVISEADIVMNRSAGYRVVNGEIKNQTWVSPSMNTTADGSLYLSILDLIKWEEALSKRRLLRPASYDAIWTPAVLESGKITSYGFGWSIKSLNGGRLIEHGGAWQGFRTVISRYVDERLSVIVLANSSNANPQRLAHGVAEIVNPSLRPRAVLDAGPEISTELRELFASLLSGKADRNRFTLPVQQSLFDRKDRLLDYLEKLGPILDFYLLRLEKLGDAVAYDYEVQFGSMTITLEIVREHDGKISRLEIHPE